MMFQILIVSGVAVAALAFLTFHGRIFRKLGGFLILAASFLCGYFMTGRYWVGALCVVAWFFIPWLEILTRIRRLRLPLEKNLRQRRPPSRDRFPSLNEFTSEIETSGFQFVEDTGWQWEDMDQFVRIFYNPETKTQATVCLHEQGYAAFAYLVLASRTQRGQVWMTWNYPFAPTMKFAPGIETNRETNALTFDELLYSHEAFLFDNGLIVDDLAEHDPAEFLDLMQRETREQIDHNLDEGLIKLSGEGTFRYSWRGMVFLWYQFVKDMVRMG